jgi:hypothetical protein
LPVQFSTEDAGIPDQAEIWHVDNRLSWQLTAVAWDASLVQDQFSVSGGDEAVFLSAVFDDQLGVSI